MRRLTGGVLSGLALALVASGTATGAFAMSGPVTAYAYAAVVYPTGQYPADVTNVQAAIDQGGSVLLKSTNTAGQPTAFNFGLPQPGSGRVNVTRDVGIHGEQVSAAMSTIEGGYIPIYVHPGVNVSISGIDLEHPLFDGIYLKYAASGHVEGNRIEHVVGQFFYSPSVSTGSGILTIGGGSYVIDNNIIDDIDAMAGIGVGQYLSQGRAEIDGNIVSGTNTIAIESGGSVSVRIENNTTIPGPERNPNGSFGVGIEVNGPGDYYVSDNTAVCENPNALCILGFGPGPALSSPQIVNNHVTTRTGFNGAIGIAVLGQVSNAYIGQNQVDGTGAAALSTLAACCRFANDLAAESFVGNDIARFTGSLADVFFDQPTHDTFLEGFSGTVIDLGTNDSITGFTNASAANGVAGRWGGAADYKIDEIQNAEAEWRASAP